MREVRKSGRTAAVARPFALVQAPAFAFPYNPPEHPPAEDDVDVGKD